MAGINEREPQVVNPSRRGVLRYAVAFAAGAATSPLAFSLLRSGRDTTVSHVDREKDPKPFRVDGWNLILNPPKDKASSFLVVASGNEVLSTNRRGEAQLTEDFQALASSEPNPPYSETILPLLAPLNPANNPKIIVASGGQATTEHLVLPAFRYKALRVQIEGFQQQPVIVSPLDLRIEHLETLDRILKVTRGVFSPFTDIKNSHPGVFDTYVIPDSTHTSIAAGGNVIFLGVDAFTKPAFENQAEIDTFANTAQAVLASHLQGSILKPDTATLTTQVANQWLREGGLSKKSYIADLKKLFDKKTYVGDTLPNIDEGIFTDDPNSTAALLADGLTIMKFFPGKLMDGFKALHPTAQETARDRLNAVIAVLNDYYPSADHIPSLEHWTHLVPVIDELISNLELNPIKMSK